MRANNRLASVFAVAVIGLLLVGGGLSLVAPATPQKEATKPEASPCRAIPFKLERSIPLAIQSSGVEWRGNTYHLLSLGSIRFDLDKQTSRLKAEIRAGVASFDDVDYDVSAAVFDATGKLLGATRSRCNVRRMWAGRMEHYGQQIALDFGVSLDYAQAATFMVSISKRKVLTPDDWQK